METFLFMRILLQIYRTINILSLDVSAGAVVCAVFFAHILHVEILPYGLATLALTVWVIYTIDHLRDARGIGNHASSDRHSFHQLHFRKLLIALIIGIIIDGLLILFIRRQVFVYGVALGGIVGFYLVVQRSLYFLKEVFVALLFTLGVLLPSIAVTEAAITEYQKLLFFLFFLIALLNLLIFSWFDSEKDVKDRLASFVTLFGQRFTAGWIYTLFIIFGALLIFIWYKYGVGMEVVVLFSMAVILLVIFIRSESFRKNEYFRLAGDAIFYLPVFYLLWDRL
jgi:4-hydroxybenzoate polyprenyltransferase